MKESEIRSRAAYDRYLEILARDVENLLDPDTFVDVSCPVCAGESRRHEFNKGRFGIMTCERCGTVYASPRPRLEDLSAFYVDAPSTSYWVNEFFMPVLEARRVKVFRPRAEYVAQRLPELQGGAVVDVGAGLGLFLEELAKLWPSATTVAIEPSSEQVDICIQKGLDVIPCILEELPGGSGPFDLVTAFELFEHLYEPRDFLHRVSDILKPGGYFLMTTLSGWGFDIQVLWEHARAIMPPAHLNFPNPHAMQTILADVGLEPIEISTPGVLDWDIVEGATLVDGRDVGRFFRWLAENGTAEAKQDLQAWITRHGMSSHMRVLARKLP